MSSRVVSSAEQTLHFCASLNHLSSNKPLPDQTSVISFSSQVAKSKISIKNSFGPGRARKPARTVAFYSPPAETAETLYQVLGIADKEAISGPEIKKAYKKMARLYHPDISPPGRVDEYTRRFVMVHQAYETLSNPQTRALYDRDLAAGFGPTTKSHRYNEQENEEKAVWRSRWESQLDELKRRGGGNRGKMSWGARMRSQT